MAAYQPKGGKIYPGFYLRFGFSSSENSRKPVFQEAGPKQGQMGSPRKFNVTFGIMPSYGSTKIGLEIDAISKEDGPAAVAGMKKETLLNQLIISL